ncbi:hypothetical protein SALBM217S_08532 [Streptomyces griseoloalbus]
MPWPAVPRTRRTTGEPPQPGGAPEGGVLRHAHWWQRGWVRCGRGDHAVRAVRAGDPGAGAGADGHGRVPGRAAAGRAARAVAASRPSGGWAGWSRPWRQPDVRVRLGRVRGGADRDRGEQLRHAVDSDGDRRPGRRGHSGLDRDRAGGRGSAKAAAVLLVFLFRRRDFAGIVDGVVVAGFTATGFAFTENVLYLGNAFGAEQLTGGSGVASVTAATFFVRIVMSPVRAPPVHGADRRGCGLASPRCPGTVSACGACCFRSTGLLLAMGMHALSKRRRGPRRVRVLRGVRGVHGAAFAVLTWLVVWTRQRELGTVQELPAYAAAGWLRPAEPFALGSMRARRLAREATPAGTGAGRRRGRWRAVRGVRDVAGVPAAPGARSAGGGGLRDPGAGVAEGAVAAGVARPALEHAARMTAPRCRTARAGRTGRCPRRGRRRAGPQAGTGAAAVSGVREYPDRRDESRHAEPAALTSGSSSGLPAFTATAAGSRPPGWFRC